MICACNVVCLEQAGQQLNVSQTNIARAGGTTEQAGDWPPQQPPIQRRRTGPLGNQSVNIYNRPRTPQPGSQTLGPENVRPPVKQMLESRLTQHTQEAFRKGMAAQMAETQRARREQENAEREKKITRQLSSRQSCRQSCSRTR